MKITVKQLRKIIKEEVGRHAHPSNDPEWEEKQQRYADVFGYGNVPMDYEECGYCGYDHSYNPEEAAEWHAQNDMEGYR